MRIWAQYIQTRTCKMTDRSATYSKRTRRKNINQNSFESRPPPLTQWIQIGPPPLHSFQTTLTTVLTSPFNAISLTPSPSFYLQCHCFSPSTHHFSFALMYCITNNNGNSNNKLTFMWTSYVAGIVLFAVSLLTLLTVTSILWGSYYLYPHFTKEKTEAQRG